MTWTADPIHVRYKKSITEDGKMYYVPDGTEQCGYYECEECGGRFLDLRIAPRIVCPYCGEEPDMEIGPDEEMPAGTITGFE
jgi:rubrerythrin